MKPWNHRTLKTVVVLVLVNVAFLLGQLSERFSGSTKAWVAVMLCLATLVLCLFLVIRDIWKYDVR